MIRTPLMAFVGLCDFLVEMEMILDDSNAPDGVCWPIQLPGRDGDDPMTYRP